MLSLGCGVGVQAETPDELKRAVDAAMDSSNPTLINAVIDPAARSEYFNAHRNVTPGHEGWERVATPGAPNKYLMISADCHVNEPPNLWVERIDEKYRHRLPRIEVDADGVKWSIVEGYHPVKIRDLKVGPSAAALEKAA